MCGNGSLTEEVIGLSARVHFECEGGGIRLCVVSARASGQKGGRDDQKTGHSAAKAHIQSSLHVYFSFMESVDRLCESQPLRVGPKWAGSATLRTTSNSNAKSRFVACAATALVGYSACGVCTSMNGWRLQTSSFQATLCGTVPRCNQHGGRNVFPASG